jgi:hypothetical protein
MYFPTTILSENSKTGCSLNLPIAGHCRPTKNCSRTCYARYGHTALPVSKNKQRWLSDYLKGSDITQLIGECRGRTAVRLNGTGDLNKEHVPNILKLAKTCPATVFYGMTRKIEIAKALNNKLPNLKFMVSVDSSTPKSIWENYKGTLCWGPRFAGDVVPNLKNIRTIFPYHFAGKIVKKDHMPHDPRDCPAIWHKVSGCLSCGKCWNW